MIDRPARLIGRRPGRVLFVKRLGVGPVIAVALDATAIRGILVPALPGLLGDRAWWAPRPLRRIHAAVGLASA